MTKLSRFLPAAIFVLSTIAVSAQQEIIIKARVDGPSELIVTKEGFQWKNGTNAKPGRHKGRNEPTYIDDVKWIPEWGEQVKDRGVDESDVYLWQIDSLDMRFELLAVGHDPEVKTIEPRTAPSVSYGADSIVINIPDPEPSSRWYVFALISEADVGGK